MNPTYTHILNPISQITNPQLFQAQTITFETLELALKYAKAENLWIEPYFVVVGDEKLPEQSAYAKSSRIHKSVLDYGKFSQPRKLPLVRHLFETAYMNSNADYIIFTNIDIGLLPHFYQVVNDIILSGVCSFTITRRTLVLQNPANIQLATLFAEIGQPHRGWDCFIFPRVFIPKMILENLCTGAPLVGLGIIANMMAIDPGFKEFKHLHLTFHIGNDRAWNKPVNNEYIAHNRSELSVCLYKLNAEYGNFPKGSPPKKYLSWHRIPLIGFTYDWLNSHFYIPVRYFRRR